MHDVLAHSLSGLVLNLEGAMLLAAEGGADPPVSDAMGRAHRLARAGLEEARRAIGMLRDDALPGPQRLSGLAAEFEADTGVACQVTVTGAETDLGTDAPADPLPRSRRKPYQHPQARPARQGRDPPRL